jgi:hypothetical protein
MKRFTFRFPISSEADSDARARESYDCPALKSLTMTLQKCVQENFSFGYSNIRQADDASMGFSLTDNQFTEVFVHRNDDTVLLCRKTQDSQVAEGGIYRAYLQDVVSLITQPVCDLSTDRNIK